MPHGTPDWGLVGPKQTVYGLDDLGEHAVRSGSPHLWDRRGDVYYSTDFREGFGALWPFYWGPGDLVCLNTGHTRHGAYAVKLWPGEAPFYQCGLEGHFALPRASGMGLEFSFSTDDGHDNWQWDMLWHMGVNRYLAMVQFDIVNSRLSCWEHPGAWHPFAENVPWLGVQHLTNTGKMVVDSLLWEYNRFLLNDVEYPLTGIAIRHWTVAPALADTFFQVALMLTGRAPEYYWGFVDSVIVTQNEPM